MELLSLDVVLKEVLDRKKQKEKQNRKKKRNRRKKETESPLKTHIEMRHQNQEGWGNKKGEEVQWMNNSDGICYLMGTLWW